MIMPFPPISGWKGNNLLKPVDAEDQLTCRDLPSNEHPWAVHSAPQVGSLPTTACLLAPSASVELLGWKGDNLLKPEDAKDQLTCRGGMASRLRPVLKGAWP